MKFGMFTSGYQRLPLEKCFTDAAQLGYDYIELWGGYPHAFAPDVIEDYREIRRLQEHYGIPVPVYTPEHNAYPYNYMLGTEKQWRNCMAYLEVSVRAAGLIGAGQMLISVGHGGECPAELRRARLRRSVEHLARAAEREHVVLLLETLSPLESNTCTRLHELKELLEAVDSPWLMGMCDVVPAGIAGRGPGGLLPPSGKQNGPFASGGLRWRDGNPSDPRRRCIEPETDCQRLPAGGL